MLHLLTLLLASGYVTLCSHIREYHLIKEAKTWDEAQISCRKNYTDLATIGSHDDMKRLENVTAASGVTEEIWIGLTQTHRGASWLWSVGETQSSHGVAEYTNWSIGPNSSHHCGGMRADGKWRSALCETPLPFVCQEEGSGRVYIVHQEKTWRDAQEYCRLNNTDLASVRSQTENQALQQTVFVKGSLLSLMWIGLFRDEWKWSDKSDSSFRYWARGQPNDDGVCALYRPSDNRWYDRGCTSLKYFFCYSEKKVMRQIVRVEMKSNSFFDFSDAAVSKAILNQIQQRYDGVKLQWRVQPDGKIFHKKEKKEARTEACYNTTL